MMKHFIVAVFMLGTALLVRAQVQQGYVKTIGRENAPGHALEGVTLRVSGNVNAMVSNAKGSFSFPIQGRRFRFSRVTKNGFELADGDFLHQEHGFSPDAPVVVAMVSTKELQREREAIEERTRTKMDEQFKKEIKILQGKYDRTIISENEYEKRLLALEEKYDSLETLVRDFSDRHARIDYDYIDSIDIVINRHIENGELEEAKQLILSKGDLDERQKKLEDDRNRVMLEIQNVNKEQQDFAADLYKLYEMAKSKNKIDSAFYYLERRYLTDTTQVNYLYDLVSKGRIYTYPKNVPLMKKLESYWLKLHDYVIVHGESLIPGDWKNNYLAHLDGDIGHFYFMDDRYDMAIAYYRKQLQTIKDRYLGNEYAPLNSIGYIHFSQENYKDALTAYQEALYYCDKNKKDNSYTIFSIKSDMAKTYYLMGDKEMSMNEYMDAESYFNNVNDSNEWRVGELYTLQGFIAKSLEEKGKHKEAITYYSKAMQNTELCYNLTHQIKYINHLAIFLKELQNLYALQGQYKPMRSCAEKAMEYANKYMERRPSPYSDLMYAEVMCLLAYANANQGNTKHVERNLVDCLKKSEFASNVFKERYNKLAYDVYNTFAVCYAKDKSYDESINAVNKAISLCPDELRAYRHKRDILKSMGKKGDAKNVEDEIVKIQEKTTEDQKTNISISVIKDPVWEYKYHYLRNN